MAVAQPKGLEETQENDAGDRFTDFIKRLFGRTLLSCFLMWNLCMILGYSPLRLCAGSWHTVGSGKLCGDMRNGDCHPILRLGEGGVSSRACLREEGVLLSGESETSLLCGVSTFCEGLASSCVS